MRYEPLLHIVLHQPEIPQNTGNIGRTCVAVGAKLWLVRPLGFRMDARHLRRAGMDYWEHLEWEAVDGWSDLVGRLGRGRSELPLGPDVGYIKRSADVPRGRQGDEQSAGRDIRYIGAALDVPYGSCPESTPNSRTRPDSNQATGLPPRPLWFFSKTATRLYTDAGYRSGDALVFGSETQGLPPSLLQADPERVLRIPMRPEARSLNLASAVAIAAYEVLRQIESVHGAIRRLLPAASGS